MTGAPAPAAGGAVEAAVGVAGWAYADWSGPVYPRTRGRAFHPLSFLAPFVDVLEVNATFYALPRREHVARWAALAAPFPHLTFTAKLPQDATHAAWSPAAAGPVEGLLRALEEALAPLADAGRLEALLAQFPLGFHDTAANRRHLEALAARPWRQPLVAELRHRSWFTPEARRFVGGLALSVAHLDLPTSPEHLPADAPPQGPLGYLRLHGRNATAWFDPRAGRDARYDHRYTPGELDAIESAARRIAAAAPRTLVIANNHYGGKALAAALELRARLRGHPVPAPATVVEAFPDLRPWVEPRGQSSLFPP